MNLNENETQEEVFVNENETQEQVLRTRMKHKKRFFEREWNARGDFMNENETQEEVLWKLFSKLLEDPILSFPNNSRHHALEKKSNCND